MEIEFICPYWGWSVTSNSNLQVERTNRPEVFIEQVMEAGYNGIEIDIPAVKEFEKQLLSGIGQVKKQRDFTFIVQQWLPPAKESFEDYQKRFTQRLEHLTTLRPD